MKRSVLAALATAVAVPAFGLSLRYRLEMTAARASVNEHWFTSLPHAQVIIEAWRREYNKERPKKGWGGLTPAQYAKQLTKKQSTVTAGL